ncbi:hypothetical protein [Streptomyces sp. NPDC003077]|uniref:hypothetical protein n=1 Tax=Streptomyces sp. NPDC003077 TaxID=3154443 RepID=UPI0033B5DF37
MNNPSCSTPCVASRPLTGAEVSVLIIIVISAAVLAAVGFQSVSVIVLIVEAATVGLRLLHRLRGSSRAELGITEV